MKKILLLLLLINVTILSAQKNFPYELTEGSNSLNAYWYAVPTDSIYVEYADMKLPFRSVMHVYGKIPEGDFSVSVKASSNGEVFFNKSIEVTQGKVSDPKTEYFVSNGYFRLEYITETELKKPDTIELKLTDSNNELSKSVACTYHTISGRMTDFDGNPMKGFFAAGPDAFMRNVVVWADDNGYYSIQLPERSYNAFMSVDENYGKSTLEYWGYRMIVDRDETLDIRIGNGEMFNLHVWGSNGGPLTYFIYFRPMALPLALLPDDQNTSEIVLDNKTFTQKSVSPDFSEKDITVKLNGDILPIISVQPVYETYKSTKGLVDADSITSMSAYIVQVERPISVAAKKLTFEVSYDTYVTVNGEQVRVNSMGTYQLYSSFDGNSESTF